MQPDNPIITADALKPTTPTPYSTPAPTLTPTVPDVPALATTPAEDKAQAIIDDTQKKNLALADKGAFTASQETAQDISGKTQTVTDLTNRFNTLKSEALAIPLQFDQKFAGTGATEGGVQPLKEAAIRKNAIESLSVGALLQAAQGNLTTAQGLVDRAVKAKYDPLEAEIQANKDNLDLILKSPEYTTAEKNQAQKQKEAQDARQAALDKKKQSETIAQTMAAAALKNNPNDAKAAAAAQHVLSLDPASPTYLSDVYNLLGSYQSDPVAVQNALLQNKLITSEIAKNNAEAAKTAADASGGAVTQVVNASGKTVSIPTDTYNDRQSLINQINTVINDPQLRNVVGGGRALQFINPASYLPGAPQNAVKNAVAQITAELALANRAELKGSGAISDFESRTLEKSGSAFGTNLSYADAQHALAQVRGVLTTMNGGQAEVEITDKDGNKQTGYADTDAINKLVSAGLTVKYR